MRVSPRHSPQDSCPKTALNGGSFSLVSEGQGKLRSVLNKHRSIERYVKYSSQIGHYWLEDSSRHWGIFQADASNNEHVQQFFTQIARLLQVEEDIDSVKRILANILQVWLLVFDNTDDPNLSYLPQT